VFAFEIYDEPIDSSYCETDNIVWFEGPFFFWINTTTLALEYCEHCVIDYDTAVEVPTALFFAPRNSSVIGRVYVDHFSNGSSLLNKP
jgi:hypothetical protein